LSSSVRRADAAGHWSTQLREEQEENERVQEARVETLAREIAKTINEGRLEEREGLREFAVGLLREEVQDRAPAAAVPAAQSTGTFNPFGIGIPLVLMGSVMVFLFPPVGLLMFAAAAAVIAWGIGATLLARK